MHRVILCALFAACVLGLPNEALAQSAGGDVRFAIAPLPLRDALVQAGLQGGVSIDVSGSERCGSSRGVRGQMPLPAALSRLTLGTGCAVTTAGPGAWRVVRRAPARPADTQGLPNTALIETAVDEVIVTAARSEDLRLSRAPYGISVLDGLSLERSGVSDLSGLAGRVAGLTVTNLGPGRDKVFIRGMADGPVAGQSQALVGLYLDDVRLTYDAPDPALRLADIERVEVLRGPQGALYGSGSMAGVVQVVAQAPDVSGFYGRGMVEVGATRGGASSHTAELMVNLPLLEERLAVRAVGYDEVGGGYVDDRGLGLTNTGGSRRQGLRLSGLWQVNDNWTARGGVLAQTIRVDDSQYATEGPADPYARRRSLREPSRNDFDGLWLSIEGDLGWARLKASSSIQSHALDARYDATPFAALFGLTGLAAFDQSDALSADVHELRLSGEVNPALSWRAGLFFSEYSHQRVVTVSDATSGVVALQRQRRDHTDEMAVFGDVAWSLTERLKLTVGGRLFRLGVEHRSQSTEPGVDFVGEDALVGFAPRFVVEYALDRVIFYALATEGYRASGFNAGALGTGGAQPQQDVRSDEIVSAEAGARFTLFDRRLKGRVAAFTSRWTDIQSDRFDARGLPFTANLGDGRNRGLEAELEWRDDDWVIDGHVMFNDPELTDPDPGFSLGQDSRLPSVADFSIQAGAARRFMVGDIAMQSEARLSYVGPTEVSLAPGLRSVSAGTLEGRVAAIADIGRWSVRLAVDNTFDVSDDTFSFGNPFFPAALVDTPQRPITAHLALIGRF